MPDSMIDRVGRLPQQTLSGLVHGYRLLLKPWIGNVCRFEPSCSSYALQALSEHGAMRGSALASWRVLRCHPWCEGGHDPVPQPPSQTQNYPDTAVSRKRP